MKKEDLLKIIAQDELGLLTVKPQNSGIKSPDERLLESFNEINDFIVKYGKEPISGGDIQEHKLASRLHSIRNNKVQIEQLEEYDVHGLLDIDIKEINSISDIISTDEFGLLEDDDQDIFSLKHVPDSKERAASDFIAKRKPCKDFDKYKDLFIKCQQDLASNKCTLKKFSSDKDLEVGNFYVLNGILLYLKSIGETKIDEYGKTDGRIYCIFENGTESRMLLRSLGKGLYENGKLVTKPIDTLQNELIQKSKGVNVDDTKTGFIYILKSLSTDKDIQEISNLYKIGYATCSVEDRVKDAVNDPTYLMAPVAIVSTYECYNFNPQKMEQLLHNFFGYSCLEVDVFDKGGKRYTPREWFIAPLEIIEKAVELIINGSIVNYRYDHKLQIVTLR